ncbi:MAG: glycerophosphodiester phosphodiesterase [Burkholderiales bacterium]
MLILAHRGLHQSLPENTLAAFEAAVKRGCDGIETDVRLSRDGLPLLLHDRVLNKERPMTELKRSEAEAILGHAVPTLDEALETFPAILWNIEIKTPQALPAALKILKHFQKTRRLVVSSFRHDVVLGCAEVLDMECALLSAQRPVQLQDLIGAVKNQPKIRTLVWDCNILDETLLREAAAAGWRSWVYGAITRAEHERCAALGLSALITDHPHYLLK